MSRRTSAAICSRSCRRSTSAPRRWATASGPPRLPPSTCQRTSARSRCSATAASGTTASTSSIGNAVFNKHDGVTLIVDNFYSAATGGQDIPSSRAHQSSPQDEQQHRRRGARRRRAMGAPDRSHLRRREDARHAARGADDEGRGTEDHRRLLGMHAEQAAPRAPNTRQGDQGGRTCRAREIRRRRGYLHRRPCLHPSVGLPVAVGQTYRRSVEGRSGRRDRRELRRLRQLRRGRRGGGALPILLSRRGRPQCLVMGSVHRPDPRLDHRVVRATSQRGTDRFATGPG